MRGGRGDAHVGLQQLWAAKPACAQVVMTAGGRMLARSSLGRETHSRIQAERAGHLFREDILEDGSPQLPLLQPVPNQGCRLRCRARTGVMTSAPHVVAKQCWGEEIRTNLVSRRVIEVGVPLHHL